jgi:hypothetical protein
LRVRLRGGLRGDPSPTGKLDLTDHVIANDALGAMTVVGHLHQVMGGVVGAQDRCARKAGAQD